jgi:hypothetical protein
MADIDLSDDAMDDMFADRLDDIMVVRLHCCQLWSVRSGYGRVRIVMTNQTTNPSQLAAMESLLR